MSSGPSAMPTMTATDGGTDGRADQRSVGNSTRPPERKREKGGRHGCDARHLQTAAADDDDDVGQVRQRRKERKCGREEGRERQKRTKRGGREGCRQRGKSEKVRGSKRKCRPPPLALSSFLPLCRRWSGWGMHATASRDGLRTQREGGRFGPLPAPDPELTAAVQSHDPPRAKLYHIHSSLETLRSLSPLLFPLCIPDPGHPHQTLPGVCLSVCPPACRAEVGGRERGFGTRAARFTS